MSDFITKTIATDTTAPDPTKHVNYVYGMVLGADDFNQEYAYLAGRDQWLARDAIGYGTLRGLQVKIENDGTNGPRVAVAPGTALSPRGQLICVDTEQCASLNGWLAANKPAGNSVKVYVTLSYRECLTDNVPIPGEPCRDESLNMDASRRQDDFLLALRTQPPTQFEEDTLRDFVAWLRQIPLEPNAAAATTLENFAQAVRTAMHLNSTTTPSDIVFGAPPATLKVPDGAAPEYWRTALRIWTTELRPRQDGLGKFVKVVRRVLTDQIAQAGETAITLAGFADLLRQAAHLGDAQLAPGYLDEQVLAKIRIPADPVNPTLPAQPEDFWQAAFTVWSNEILPRWIAKGGECAWPPDEGSVLLAELTIPLADGFKVAGNASVVVVHETSRPYVLHLRMLQEWLLSDNRTLSTGGSTIPPGTAVVPETSFGQAAKVGDLNEYARANHTHGTPPINGDLTLEGDQIRITRIRSQPVSASIPNTGQVLTFDGTEWVATDHIHSTPSDPIPAHVANTSAHDKQIIAGDVTGTLDKTHIALLQGKSVNAPAPNSGQVLTFDGTQWTASTPSDPMPPHVANTHAHDKQLIAGDVTGTLDKTHIARLQGIPVADVQASEGQVLKVIGSQWVPTQLVAGGGDFVEHPAGLPPYAIVAAGTVSGRPNPRLPVYNELKLVRIRNGLLLYSFNGYRLPKYQGSFQYMIKALAVQQPDNEIEREQAGDPARFDEMEAIQEPLVVSFRGFTDEGFVLQVMLNGESPGEDRLQTLEIMIEVSRYERVG